MSNLNEKQSKFLEELVSIKEHYVDFSLLSLNKDLKLNWSSYPKEYIKLGEHINTEEQVRDFRFIQNELVDEIIYRILEVVDGYGNLDFEIDLIDKETKESLKAGIQLHDQYATRISEK
ncbi:hypothetical protein SAMN05661091_2457 [Paenibacillus uliginis N3/975]|uniref:Uncharacterized protein n=1 Tax=Paenibacillus uliginis N3/975 TaxID=1313296 RepID=A0A1X7HD89_9BACL|nr:hypothetical protein [Paenibacillus uliginis]SMF83798.1 hypothetical protein SAMN05661091_2457 [Paenibacillus uliginis N3/975]